MVKKQKIEAEQKKTAPMPSRSSKNCQEVGEKTQFALFYIGIAIFIVAVVLAFTAFPLYNQIESDFWVNFGVFIGIAGVGMLFVVLNTNVGKFHTGRCLKG